MESYTLDTNEKEVRMHYFEGLNLSLAVLPVESRVWTSVRRFGKILSVTKDCVFYSYNGTIYIDKVD